MKVDHALEYPLSALDDECGRPLECAKRRLPTVAAFVIALASTIVLTLAGCASTAGIASQADPLPAERVGLPAGGDASPALAPDWWRAFGVPQLSALIERALAASRNL